MGEPNVAPSSERVEEAVRRAGEAFWAEVVAHFPETTTGDFPPDVSVALDREMIRAVAAWVYYNHPFYKTGVPR